MSSTVQDSSTIDVVLSGELDMAAAFQLEPELDRLLAAPGILAVGARSWRRRFRRLDRTGSASVIKDRAARFDIEFKIGRASASVERILDLTGTRSVLGGR
jgi:hypothetical protein